VRGALFVAAAVVAATALLVLINVG